MFTQIAMKRELSRQQLTYMNDDIPELSKIVKDPLHIHVSAGVLMDVIRSLLLLSNLLLEDRLPQ